MRSVETAPEIYRQPGTGKSECLSSVMSQERIIECIPRRNLDLPRIVPVRSASVRA